MATKTFHHGNLRNELIELAAQWIEKTGYEDLSMRELAGALGVSAGAPYRHFANKDALLREVASRTQHQLSENYRAAMASESAPKARFRLACQCYIEMALERPQVFRMMFTSEAYLGADEGSPGSISYGLFVDLAAEAFDFGKRSDAELAALAAWSTIHGYAMIRIDSRAPQIAHTEQALGEVLDRACGQ